MSGGIGRVTHHPDYYLSDGSVSFLTGGILFRVHKSFFERESETFRDLFEEAANDDPPAGTDACPFTLKDVTPGEFAQFLWVWYDKEYTRQQQGKEIWLVILKLATRWHFDKIKELALRELEALEMPAAERISIYDANGITGERLISSYVDMCKSPNVPTVAEACLLQLETLIDILQAREKAQQKAIEMGHETPTSACLEEESLREIVSSHFEKGVLNPRSSGTSTGSANQAPDLNLQRKTRATPATITMREPQVPDRKVLTALSHQNNSPQTGSANEKQEKKKEAKEKAEREKAEKAGQKPSGTSQWNKQ